MATFLFVHGSWHGAWCWHKVVHRIEAAGHRALALDLPGHGREHTPPGRITLEHYVTSVGQALEREAEPVVLVAHSRGGIVASQAAEAFPDRIRRLVYLAAFLLPNQARVVDYATADRESLIGPNLEVNPEEGWDMLAARAFRPALYADCAEDDVALAALLLTPEPLAPALTPLSLTEERFGRAPRVYIELLRDRAVTPSLQRRMHKEMPCEAVLSIDASHSAYFSEPDALVAHLLSIA